MCDKRTVNYGSSNVESSMGCWNCIYSGRKEHGEALIEEKTRRKGYVPLSIFLMSAGVEIHDSICVEKME